MDDEVRDVLRAFHHLRAVGRLAAGADDLLVVGMADEEDLVAGPRVSDGLVVHLGDERAGGVHRGEVALLRLGPQRGAHAVGAEDHDGAVGHLGEFLDELHAAAAEPVHHMTVVHDLVIDVDGLVGADVQELVHHVDRHVDAGAEAAGIRKDDLHRTGKCSRSAQGFPPPRMVRAGPFPLEFAS